MAELGPPVVEPAPPGGASWDQGASRRFLVLAGARGGAQLLGLIWFFAAARQLSDVDYGELATGLAFFAIFAGIGDLGTTRGIVRFVAADHTLLWPVFRRAVVIRVLGGLAVGTLTAVVIGLLPVPVSAPIVLLAGLVAVASGVTELAYAALRSIGQVRTEVALLLAERIAFLAIGLVVLWRDGDAIAVLVVYLATNVASALVGGVRVWRTADRTAPVGRAWSLGDAEARSTAVAFALVTVSPRLAPVIVALLASAVAVGEFSVAQRPIEAMTLFALSTAAPLFPIVRQRLAAGRTADAERAAVSVVTAISVALVPLLAWFVVSPGMVLDLFFGAGRYADAAPALRLLALTALTWTFRGVAEFVLLAEERARTFLVVTIVGAVVTVVAGVPLVAAFDTTGGAWSVVVAEVVMTAMLVAVAPSLVDLAALRSYGLVAGFGLLSALTLLLTRSSTALSVVTVAVFGAVALAAAVWLTRRLEARA